MDADEKELWHEADRILDELLDLPAPERLPRLRQLPLAPVLREYVKRLLAADEETGGPLDVGPLHEWVAATEAAARPAADLGGQRLGRWRLLEPIGQGGMAVVYRAVSCEPPLDQQAAVKLLTLGALARGGRERFLREQRLLARLRHPYIAPLYEAGVAADGTPWLAMALVEGERIDDWCERHDAGLDARVGLVLQVAEALACAHRNLVIHRDVKPSNVLVDADGHARLLDFGIGALIDAEHNDRTTTGLHALTPEYAAPEQFAGAIPTTAMDVYGLGTLLYRLLGGRPPGRPGPGPLAPPSRLAASAAVDAAPRRWARQLRGDLDLIVMKALAPEPERRYPSIDALAADLRHWQARRPIQARAPSLGYRLRRFLSRNRWGAAASAALVVALLGGVAVAGWQAHWAREEARRARAAAAESEAQLTYVDSLLELLAVPASAPEQKRDVGALVRRVAERARKDLAGRDAALARVENALAGVAAYGGDYPQSAELARSALARRRAGFGDDAPETAEAMQTMSFALRQKNTAKDRAEALELAERATAILRRHAADTPQLVMALDHLALLQMERDDTARALALTDEAQSICDRRVHDHPFCERPLFRRADLQFRLGHFQAAIAGFSSLLELKRRRLGPDNAQTLQVGSLLAMSYSRSGAGAKAVPLLEQILAQQRRIYGRPTEQTFLTQQSLGEALSQSGDYPRALQQFGELTGQIRSVLGEGSAQMAYALCSQGLAEYDMGRYREAAGDFQRSRAIYAAIFGADSAFAMANLLYYADTLRERGRPHDALPLQRQAQATMERLLGADSLYVARGLSRLAATEVAVGDGASALAHYDRAVAIYRASLPADNPLPAVIAAPRSNALLQLGRVDQAREAARAALGEIEAKARHHPLYYGQTLAPYVRAMCATAPTAPAECAEARRLAGVELRREGLAGRARLLLTAALDDTAVAIGR
jgi:hypothetical protein